MKLNQIHNKNNAGDSLNADQKKQQGFTLVEALISFLILAVGLLAMANMQLTAMNVNTSARRMTEGTSIAKGKLEELMSLPFDDPNLVSGEETPAEPFSSLTWTVEDTPGGVANIKLITVRIEWKDRTEKEFTLRCVKASVL